MSSKHLFIAFIIIALLGAGGYFWAAEKKQAAVEKAVRTWQEGSIEYLSFDYKAVNSRLWDNTITLEHVQVTYPVLMSINEVQVNPTLENNILEDLYINAHGVNFTVPSMTENQPWQGDLIVDYVYDPDLKEVDLYFAPDFPGLLVGELETSFVNITPSVDIIFNYTDILLQELHLELQNEGLIKSESVIAWANTLNNTQQRDAFNNFVQNQQTLNIKFVPEYPVAIHRLLESPMIFWQHPAVEVNS